MNVYNTSKQGLTPRDLGDVCNRVIQQKWRKEFTLEFSRDRKSMSTYCVSSASNSGAKMFVKVKFIKMFFVKIGFELFLYFFFEPMYFKILGSS